MVNWHQLLWIAFEVGDVCGKWMVDISATVWVFLFYLDDDIWCLRMIFCLHNLR